MQNKKQEDVKKLTDGQQAVVDSVDKKLVVSASAGSGKTFVVVEKLIKLICEKNIPVSRLLVLTFTKAAASELKSRLYTEILTQPSSPFLLEQLDDILVSDISTIDSFCEKVIKRNINKLSIPENFVILEEKSARTLKNVAFNRTIEHFSLENPEEFNDIYFAFKRNNEMLEECMISLQDFFDSLSNSKEVVEKFKTQRKEFHLKACEKLKEMFALNFMQANSLIEEALVHTEMNGEKLGRGHCHFIEGLKAIINIELNNNIFDICKLIAGLLMPKMSTAKCLPQVRENLNEAKELVKEVYEISKALSLTNQKMIENAEEGKLCGEILEFYSHYAQEYKILKENRSALDFADIEKYAQYLLSDDEVKKSLQERYEYIIIDEYQDTNRLQESILKPISEGGYFIAVGDIKQGIYGFRNASKEIMNEDIKNFKDSEEGNALFLRGNFRTDNRILSFVNSVFEKLMTIESVGIDYKETSLLEGLNEFQDDGLIPVSVDIVCPQKDEVEDSVEEESEEKNEWDEIYSVKEASASASYKYKEEVMTIAARIEEALQTQIYLPKQNSFRQVELGDIALLFRNRSNLMRECVQYLQEKGFAVNADIKENLIEDSQISLILSLIKLSINQNDDISLASVMVSPFGHFSFEELCVLRKTNLKDSFYQVLRVEVENNGSPLHEKIRNFFEMLDRFKYEINVFGIVKALERLFVEKRYDEFISTLPDASLKRNHINKLFTQIRSGNLDFCPQELISQVENSKKDDKMVSDGGNAVTITTIHATKGLEYPIVIICGGGENLNNVYNKNYISSYEFGLGSYLYSYEDNLRLPSPAFIAGKLERKKREMVDELMLFYVEMTRAKNHLYIIGSGKEKDFSFSKLEKQNTYLKMIFYCLGENFTSNLFMQEQVTTENIKFSVISQVEEENSEDVKEILETKTKLPDNLITELEKFYSFEYKNKDLCKFAFKNSVTGVTKTNKIEEYNAGEVLEKEDEYFSELSEEGKRAGEKAIEVGNSYHEALKLIEFNNVYDLSSLELQLNLVKPNMSEGYFENIDQKLLLKNILLIKQVIGKCQLFKEKEFIMQSSPSEINGTGEFEEEQNIIVQGIIDLFGVGEENILIDYKYTSQKDEKKIIERYSQQIRLYSIAIEKAFGKKIKEKYILSLKDAKLIKLK